MIWFVNKTSVIEDCDELHSSESVHVLCEEKY